MPTLPTARPVGTPTITSLSPAQAAQLAKVSRRTIMRAIDAQELRAFRDNRNRWQISQEELEKWTYAQFAPSGHRPHDAHPTAHPPPDEIALELAAARANIAQLEARLDERAALVRMSEMRAQAAEAARAGAENRAVAAEALAAKLADLLATRPAAPPADPPAPSPRRWWPWRRG
ncbi:hypothetical protein PY32053_04748 (plasmid) [Paracoccus yeei]|uniref:Helix-turn-helix domain-containing protein n=1 Tax=Paracoccus yeei TaxID=147645 RepID=A0A386UU48_9RHOB|nr:helix-turn-helix domain-containing protein [Paracoccus yeei]AYF04233.1 hypothetical protein PY32053_04748 [Paracoccus yeei]